MNLGPLEGVLWVGLLVPVGLVLLAAVVLIAAWWARGGSSRRVVLPSTGIEVVEGLPGAGKSFFAVGELLRSVLVERRPVYTNLPLVWRVFRKYVQLKGGEELARLVFAIDRQHFERFLVRTAQRADTVEKFKNLKGDAARRADQMLREGDAAGAMELRRRSIIEHSDAALDAEFDADFGVAIYSGKDANAIYYGAVVVLDEGHMWFAQEDQKKESDLLRKYLSMHRHQLHRLIVLTQDRMKISISFRRDCQYFWCVRDRGEDAICGPLRMKHLGIKALGYAKFTRAQEEALKAEDKIPSQQFTVFHWAPWENFKFRLYNSHTHAGSKRTLMRNWSRARRDAGLKSDGLLESEEKVAAERVEKRRVSNMGFVRLRRWGRRGLLAGFLALAFVVGRGVSSQKSKSAVAAERSAAVAAVQTGKPKALPWGKLESLSKDYVRVSGQRVAVGGGIKNGAVLQAVDVRTRRSAWRSPDGLFWVWKWGSPEPSVVGGEAEVRDAKARQLARSGGGGTLEVAPAPSPSGVGPGPGVGVR